MTTYSGVRTPSGCAVTFEGDDFPPHTLPLRLDLVNHSPDGFGWGYGGSAPAQLAVALLAHHLGDDHAMELYQRFKWDVITKLQGDRWSMTDDDIRSWMRHAGVAA